MFSSKAPLGSPMATPEFRQTKESPTRASILMRLPPSRLPSIVARGTRSYKNLLLISSALPPLGLKINEGVGYTSLFTSTWSI
jgi:hypothetical protein